METVSVETLRALAEVPPEVLRALATVPPEALAALRDAPEEVTAASKPDAGKRTKSRYFPGADPEKADEMQTCFERILDLMQSAPYNVLGCIGHYRLPYGRTNQGWWQVWMDSGGGGIDKLLDLPVYKVAQVFSVLGSEVRLSILRSLLKRPMTAAELVAELRLGTTGQAYHHLRELERANAVEVREGSYHFNSAFIGIYLTAMVVARGLGAEASDEEGLPAATGSTRDEGA